MQVVEYEKPDIYELIDDDDDHGGFGGQGGGGNKKRKGGIRRRKKHGRSVGGWFWAVARIRYFYLALVFPLKFPKTSNFDL